MIFQRIALLAAVMSACWCARAAGQSTQPAGDAPALIEALAHPDPHERQKAEEGLLALGAAAREAVLAATQSPDPEIASRARDVFRRLPWALPTDSPNAQRLLKGYDATVQARDRVVKQLMAAHEISVLLRLLEEEPESEFRWHIAGQLEQVDELELDRRLRDVSADSDNAPVVFLAAKRAERVDQRRALDLFRRVVDIDATAAVPALHAIFEAYDELLGEAVRRQDYRGAAELLRRQAVRMAGTNAARVPLARLLALHAYTGPLPGFARDVRTSGAAVARPVFSDNVAGLYELLGLAPPPLLANWNHARCAAPPEIYYWAGAFFASHQLYGPAEQELTRFIARVPAPEQPDVERGAPSFYDYDYLAENARQMLSRIAAARKDDFAAAEHLRLAAELREGVDQRHRGRLLAAAAGNGAANVDEARFAEMHWRYLRAARSAGDQKKLREHLDVLKGLTPENTDIVLDVVPLLKECGQPEAARAMFDKVYAQLRAAVDQNPESADALNNLAWLCARAGERLPEALELATRAIALEPDNAAYLDTAAEANFRVGNVDEAVRLESRGLELRPNDEFMKEQLARFKAAKK